MHNHYYRVEGEKNLAYDPRTNGVIDTDREAYDRYIQQKRQREAHRQRLESMENRINNMESGLSDIKLLLTQLLEKTHGHNN